MPFTDTIREVDELRAAIQERGPISANVLKKVNYKFRLEWNYTSNSMEGNSLTRSETRSVMIGNITVHGKPIKDVLEMKGHDEVITSILKIGAGELQLSETRIRDIHRSIMHEDNPEKAALIGKWKTQDNYLFNYKNERIDFTPHSDVPKAMHRLTDWLSAQREKISRGDADALHPALLAFRFHLDYVSIHPFYDGNGRTARILTNLILIAYGYPPAWINDGVEKERYYQYLADIQGYGGSPDEFYEVMAEALLRSQRLMLDAVEGRSLDEPTDLDKKLALLKKRLGISHKAAVGLSYEPDIIIDVVNNSITPFAEAWERRLQSFDGLFETRSVSVSSKDCAHSERDPFKAVQVLYAKALSVMLQKGVQIGFIKFQCDFKNLISLNKPIGINGGEVAFTFHENRYEIVPLNNRQQALNKLYGEQLSEEEINSIVEYLGNWVYNNIETFLQNEESN